MTPELQYLTGGAIIIAFFHTITGPDHYLPFVMLSWARKWSAKRTALITFFCGLGHILSSVVLGIIGVALGIAVDHLNLWEGNRGSLAAWLMIAFGLVYFAWGLKKACRGRSHEHRHFHPEAGLHTHQHSHSLEHLHVHDQPEPDKKTNVTPWVLFILFVFGPCEPLIPLLIYPAARHSWWGVGLVAGIFGFVTVATMLSLVLLSRYGINFISFRKLERFTHAIAGGTILACGLAIQFLGL